MWLYKHWWMISASLNHCKEMGAEPGRRSLKMPAEKLGPVIAAFDKERRIPATGASHLKKLTSIKKLWETRNDLRIVAWTIFSMEILLSLLYRNWSANLFNQITRLSVNLFNNWSVNLFDHFTRLVGVPDFLRCTLRSVANHVIAWDKKPRQKRWVCFVSQK